MRVVVVGVCASGKTTLVQNLTRMGIEAYNAAQEHSQIKQLWKKKQPDILVMLDATLETLRTRRKIPWGEERLIAQRERLADAREHADLFIQTDRLTKEEVAQVILDYIRRKNGGKTMAVITTANLKEDHEVDVYLTCSTKYLSELGFTEHGQRHANIVAHRAYQVLNELGGART